MKYNLFIFRSYLFFFTKAVRLKSVNRQEKSLTCTKEEKHSVDEIEKSSLMKQEN